MVKQIFSITVMAALVAACSTRPREFRADLAAPAQDVSAFDRDMRQCQVLVRSGAKKDFKGTVAQIGLGSGVGLAAGVGASTVAASSISTASLGSAINGAAGAAATGAATALVVAPLAAFGVARIIRSGREKRYKSALGTCLSEYGYSVSSWQKQPKLKRADIAAAKLLMTASQGGEAAAGGCSQAGADGSEQPCLKK